MKLKVYIKEHWLSKKPRWHGGLITFMLVTFIILGASGAPWMIASKNLVYQEGEFWRVWSALFAHANLEHSFSNLILFIPLCYLLSSYFGYVFFPILGFFIGGINNFLVLLRLPPEVNLVGASGVVYWMGAAIITLSFLLERRESPVKKYLKAIGVALILFIPETLKIEVSYFSHFLGFVTGILCAVFWYFLFRQKFLAAETLGMLYDDEDDFNHEEQKTPVF